MVPKIHFREVADANEREQVHALNHRVFAEEIAQHPVDRSGLLVDRFDAENKYFVAVQGRTVIGMISAHGGPEFSVTKRLPNPEMLRSFSVPLEVRLLAIEPRNRSRMVLAGLLWRVYEHAVDNGYSHLLISGIAERAAMYGRMGFSALGPAVPDGEASFVPMVMPVGAGAAGNRRVRLHERHWRRSESKHEPISLMPGPVCIDPLVTRAWESRPVSHRSSAFTESYEQVRLRLNGLMRGMEAVIFPGAGTLANDAVAANLKAIFGERDGLVLSNGEFGERIAKQAASAGLRFRQMSAAWGEPWQFSAVENALDREPAWVWAVHLETSTGVLNDVARLLRMAREANCGVALDCVSSLGAAVVPDDSDTLLMASGVSGKSLGAYAGLGFVYLSDRCRRLLDGKTLCPSFDLSLMCETRGPLTTVPSPLLLALDRALELNYATGDAVAGRLCEYRILGQAVRRGLRAAGIEPLAPESIAAPNITTFALPGEEFPEQCLKAGYQIAHESGYLQSRGWGQIATMGSVTPELVKPLLDALPGLAMRQSVFAEG